MREPEDLGREANTYLDAFRGHQRDAPDWSFEAGWAGIEAGLADGASPTADGPASGDAGAGAGASGGVAVKAGLAGSLKVFAAVVVVGSGMLAGARAMSKPEPDPPAVVVPERANPTAAETTSPSPVPAPVPVPALEPALEPEPAPTPSSRPEKRSKSDRLRAQVASLARVRQAARASDCEEATRRLRRHDRQFPNGVLSEERDALEVLCACALARPSAPALLSAFRASYPSSPQTAALRKTCNSSDGRADPATREDR